MNVNDREEHGGPDATLGKRCNISEISVFLRYQQTHFFSMVINKRIAAASDAPHVIWDIRMRPTR